MNIKNKILLFIASIILLVSFSSCAKEEKAFVVGTNTEIEKAQRGEYNYEVLSSGLCNLPLVYQDENGNYMPLVANFYTSDAKTYTYTIVKDLKWSDGSLVTAWDIYFSLLKEDENDGKTNFKDSIVNGVVTKSKYESYEISSDGFSISLTLRNPNVRELSNMCSFRILPKHIFEKENITEEEQRVSLGPYVLREFNKEAGSLCFEKNPYYLKSGNLDKIVFKLFSNEDTMYAALKTNDIQMTWNYSKGIDPIYQDLLGSDVKLITATAENIPVSLSFNCSLKPFDDINLRKAISYALDYEAFVEKLGSKYASVATKGFVPRGSLGYVKTEELNRNIPLAREYMKKAGYSLNNEGKYDFSFRLSYNLSKTSQVLAAELIKTNLEEFGIEVILDGCDQTTYNAKTSNKFADKISMQAALYSYTSAGMAMENGMGSIYVDGSHPVQGGCQVFDDELRNILESMADAKNLDEYIAAGARLQQYYEGNLPFIALYWDDFVYGINKSYENIYIDKLSGLNNERTWTSIK